MKINKRYVRKVYGDTSGYDKSSALSIDKWANKEFRTGLNYLMLMKDSNHHFGNINETMSSVFGKNERDNTLTKIGVKWANRLNRIDKDHCNNSIDLSVNYKDKDFNFIIKRRENVSNR